MSTYLSTYVVENKIKVVPYIVCCMWSFLVILFHYLPLNVNFQEVKKCFCPFTFFSKTRTVWSLSVIGKHCTRIINRYSMFKKLKQPISDHMAWVMKCYSYQQWVGTCICMKRYTFMLKSKYVHILILTYNFLYPFD